MRNAVKLMKASDFVTTARDQLNVNKYNLIFQNFLVNIQELSIKYSPVGQVGRVSYYFLEQTVEGVQQIVTEELVDNAYRFTIDLVPNNQKKRNGRLMMSVLWTLGKFSGPNVDEEFTITCFILKDDECIADPEETFLLHESETLSKAVKFVYQTFQYYFRKKITKHAGNPLLAIVSSGSQYPGGAGYVPPRFEESHTVLVDDL